MAVSSARIGPPSQALLWLEPGRAFLEWGSLYAAFPLLLTAPKGDGHPTLVIPGLGGSQLSTRPLRRFLRGRGYWAHDWKLGRNLGQPEAMHALVRRLRHIRVKHGGRTVSLIGWSLGGIYARELAKLAPGDVRLVITLGTPFTGPAGATNAERAYEYFSGQRAGGTPRERFRAAPPVPTTSVWSRSDGIVAWQCSVQDPGPQAENIEVIGSHLGLGVHPLVLYAIADRLAQPEGRWKPFAPPELLRRLYGAP